MRWLLTAQEEGEEEKSLLWVWQATRVVVQRLAVRRLAGLVGLVVVLQDRLVVVLQGRLVVVLHLDRQGVVRRVCLRLKSVSQ